MTSKIDFNILLAKADKNTNNACKILEEKKLQNQKNQLKNNTRSEQQSKQAAIAFLEKKKEEIRLRTEREAKELLERKQKKQESLQSESTLSNKHKISSSNSSNKNGIVNKKTVVNQEKSNSSSNGSSLKSKGSIKPSGTSSKPILNKETTKPQNKTAQINSKSLQDSNKPKSSNKPVSAGTIVAKPKLSYSQILKLADTFHSEKLKNNNSVDASLLISSITNSEPKKSTDSASSKKNSNSAVNINSLNNNIKNYINKSDNSKINVKPNLQQNILKPKSNGTNTVSKSSLTNEKHDHKKTSSSSSNISNVKQAAAKSSTVSSVSNESKGISSWDRIISDMKKKKTNKKYEQTNVNQKAYDEYEDEDEYDSEMDDFIDDEDDDLNTNEKKDYSKYIQEIFKYNPKRYIAEEEEGDLDNMETDFHSQLKEEKRSLKMGILEDLEELKKEAEMEKKRKEHQKKRQSEGDVNDKNIKKHKSSASKT